MCTYVLSSADSFYQLHMTAYDLSFFFALGSCAFCDKSVAANCARKTCDSLK